MTSIPEITLKLNTVSFSEATEPLLKDIELTVNKGDFIILTGKPGTGKSLLLHTVTGAAEKYYDAVVDGTVTIKGVNRNEIPLPRICNYVGCMFQEPANQIISMTVKEEVAFGAANLGCSAEEIKQRSTEALAYVGLTDLADRKTQNLSGGEAQRLVLASILALKAPILLLDQPGAELDGKGKGELYRHILNLNREQGVTVILIPDNGIDLTKIASRHWEIKAQTVTEIPVQTQEKASFFPAPNYQNTDEGETVLDFTEVSYRYPRGTEGCTEISLQLKQGEFLALLGENGAGKSTVLKLAEGLIKPDKGTVTVFGEKYEKKNSASLRRKIGFLFQNPDFQLFTDSVEAELAFGLKNSTLTAEEKETRIAEVLRELNLTEFRKLHPQRLSRSRRQKLALGTALIHKPQLIIADEPTSGLDAESSEGIMTLLSTQCQKGTAVLLVTHDDCLARKYAQRMLILKNHQIEADSAEVAADTFQSILAKEVSASSIL